MATRLKDLRVVEISLVDRPANKKPLLLLRSADVPKTLQIPDELVAPLEKAVADGRLATLLKESEMAKCPKCGGELTPEDASAETCPKCGSFKKEPEMTDEEKAAEKAAIAKADKDAKDKDAAFEVLQKEATETKGQLEALRKAHEELAQKAAAAEATIKRRDAVAKAAHDFPSLKTDDVAELLLKGETLGAEYLGKLETTLRQAEALAKAGVGTEIGSGGDAAGADAWQKIEAGAAALVAKSGEKLTTAQAVDRFLTTPEGRALHREYKDAQ